MARRFCLGRIARPHGVRGEVAVEWYGEDPSLVEGPIFLEFPGGRTRDVATRSWRAGKNGILVSFEGVTDRDQAEGLRGASICVLGENMPSLDEDEAYIEDLLGREVRLSDGSLVGVLHHIETPPGQMLFALRDESHEYLFPAREEFIVSLGEAIVIDPPDGLLETCKTRLK